MSAAALRGILGTFCIWEFGSYDGVDSPPDHEEDLGTAAANELFSAKNRIDLLELPIGTGPGTDCFPVLEVTYRGDSDHYMIGHYEADDLLPDLEAVYEFFDSRMCRNVDERLLPSHYCE